MPSVAKPRVVVVGSVNLDLVVAAPRIPATGETVLGEQLRLIPGGKGANQAVAAARLGLTTSFVGRVGDDDFGRTLRLNLAEADVDLRHLQITNDVPSGVALIVVAQTGQNAICVAPGANSRLTPDDVRAAEELIAGARVLLVQLEIPLETVACALQLARRHGVETILDPAPAPAFMPTELFQVDVITPNQTEAATLLGTATGQIPEPGKAAALGPTPEEKAAAFLKRGVRAVALKRGAAGAFVADAKGSVAVPGFSVHVVDTTAAGDAFAAGLALGRIEGLSLADATRWANAAGALACTKHGAQPSLPTRAEVEELLRGATR